MIRSFITPSLRPLMYAPDLVLNALRIPPEGVPSKEECRCVACGKPIHPGDLYAPFEVSESFMDDLALASRGSSVTCGFCAPLFRKKVMEQIGKQVFTADGRVLSISKWEECAAFLRNPPKPPFVAVYSTGAALSAMHLAWRAPVTRSADLLMIRVGLRDVRIRRPVLLGAETAARELALKMGYEDGRANSQSGPPLNPFAVRNTVTFDSFEFSRFRVSRPPHGLSLSLAEHSLPQDLRFLRDLTLGELWGLVFLLNQP